MSEKTQSDRWKHLQGWLTIKDETAFRKFADEYRAMLSECHPNVEWYPVLPAAFPVLLQPILVYVDGKPVSLTSMLGVNDAVQFLNRIGLSVSHATLPSQDEFNKSMAANVLSIVEILISKGVVTQELYERKLQGNSATVDQWKSQDAATRNNIARAVEGSGPVLGQFYPKEDE